MTKRLLAARHGESELGYTLTEVLVALTILSVSVVAIVGAMSSSIFSSRVHRSIVVGDTAVRAYATQILQASYLTCATPTGGNAYPLMTNPPGGMTVTVTNITYWTGSDGKSGANFVSTCSPDNGAQRITVVAQATTNAAKQTLSFVKRSP